MLRIEPGVTGRCHLELGAKWQRGVNLPEIAEVRQIKGMMK